MNDLTLTERDGEYVVTSEAVAEGAGIQHASVLRLIDENSMDFEEFGQVRFEIRPGYNNSRVRVALLNEQQATLLMTFQRNTFQVRSFKKALVKTFFEMGRQAHSAPAELSRLDILTMALESEHRAIAAETKVAELEPKAEAFTRFMDSTSFIKIEVAARQAGVGRTTAYRLLRDARILQKFNRAPIQEYAHRFHEVASERVTPAGDLVTDYTTKVRPEHFDWLVSTLERLAGKEGRATA